MDSLPGRPRGKRKTASEVKGAAPFTTLVNIPSWENLLKSFHRLTGLPVGMVSIPDGRLLVDAGWKSASEKSRTFLLETEMPWRKQSENVLKPGQVSSTQVNNAFDMVVGTVSLMLTDQHVLELMAGPVFLNAPDLCVFRETAERNGWNAEEILRAVKKIPVVEENLQLAAFGMLRSIGEQIIDQSSTRQHLLGQVALLQNEFDDQIKRERLVKQSEEQFRSLVERIPAAVYMDAVDELSSTLYMSPQIEVMTGYSAQEWIRNPNLWLEILHPEDHDAVSAENVRTNRTGEKFQMDYRLLTRDGRTIWVRDESVLLVDSAGKRICWQGFIRDITRRKDMDSRLTEAESRYRALVEQLPMVVYVDSAERIGQTVYLSPQAKDLLGFDPDEWAKTSEPWRSSIMAEDREQVMAEFERTFKTGDPFKAEYRMVSRDGQVHWIHDEAILVRDANSKPVFWHGMMLDVTERKQAEMALAESESRYRALFDLSPDAIAVHRQGIVLLVNNAAMHLIGAGCASDVVGKPLMDFVHPEYRAVVAERTRLQIDRGQAVPSMEEKFVRLDGSSVDVDVIAAPIRFQDQPASMVIFHEITERKRSQVRMDRQFQELTVLRAVGVAVTQAASKDDLISNVIEAVGESLFPNNFGVLLIDQKQGVLRHHPSYRGNATPAERAKLSIPLDKGVTGRVARTGDPARIADVEKDPDYLEFNNPTRSELCVPLVSGETIIGVINTESRELDAFTVEDEHLLQTIAGQLGLGIEKLHLFDTERLRRREAETLSQVAQAVTASLDVNQILQVMLEHLKKILVFDTASVLLMDANGVPDLIAGLNFVNQSTTSKTANELLRTSPILAAMQADLNPVVIADVKEHPGWIWVPGAEHVRSFMAVPMVARQTMIGALMVDHATPFFYSQTDLRVAQLLAQQMAIAIENARLYQDALKAADRRSILHRVSQDMVTAIQEPEQTYSSIHEATRKLMPCDSFVIALNNPKNQQNEIVYALEGDHRFPPQLVPAGRGLTGRVVSEGVSVIVTDLIENKIDVIRIGEPQPVRSLVAVPLRLGQNTTGMISAQSYLPDAYHGEEQALLEMLASYAAVAIENARLYQDALRAAERRSILHEVSQEIVKVGLDLEKVYEAIHGAAARLMPAEAFVLSILNERNKDEILAAYLYDEGKRWPSITSPRGMGLSGKVIDSGEPLLINDMAETPLPEAIDFGDGDNVRSLLAVPLRLGEKVFGMVSVQSHLPNAYTEDDQALLDMLGAHASAAIENARLFSETRQRLTELEAVNRISTALRVAQTAEQMLPRLLDECLKILECNSGVIWLYDRSREMLVQAEARGWFTQVHENPVHPGEGIAGRVFQTATAIVSNEFASDEMTRVDTRSQIPPGWGGACVPIRTGRDVIGVLFVSVQRPRQLTQGDVDLLTTISEIAGNAIHRSVLYEQSQRQLQRLASLRTIDMAINTVLDLRVTLSILIDHLLSQLNVNAVAVFLFNPATQTLHHGASEGFRSDLIQSDASYLSSGLTGHVARTRSVVYIPRLAENQAMKNTFLSSTEGFVSYYAVPLLAKGQVKGVLEIFHRSLLVPDLDWKNFLETLASQAALAVDNASLFEELQRTNVDLSLAYDATIEGWSKALDLRDHETEGHTQRVAELSVQLAKRMGVSDIEQVHLRRGALLHDIGKMGVPDSILYKTGPLTAEEWVIMRQHPNFAYEMLYPIAYLRPALDIPYGHHERWDGTGYPRKLKGEQIPLAARIFALVDVWDALTCNRPYRQAWTREHALAYIKSGSGTHFDPNFMSAFLDITKNQKSAS